MISSPTRVGLTMRGLGKLRESASVRGTTGAVAMVGSVVIGTALAFGLVRARSRPGGAANVIMLIPLITPEIVTGVASLMLFKGVYLDPGLATLIIAETTFSISYVTVILRARVAELNPEVEEAAAKLETFNGDLERSLIGLLLGDSE